MFLFAGALVATASALVPLSSDEAAWVAIERRVAGGGQLYIDAIDNKSPAVFGLVRAIDLLPGPFEPARGVVLAALLALAGWCAARALHRLGLEQRTATAGGILVMISLAAASSLTLTIEVPAVVLVLAGIAAVTAGRAAQGCLLAASGALFDPRVALAVPALAWWLARHHGRAAAIRGGVAGGLLLAFSVVLVMVDADLRFALIHLNIASRGGQVKGPLEQLAAALRATIVPTIGTVVMIRAGRRASMSAVRLSDVLVLGVPLALVVVLSRHGFDHYWVMLIPVLVLVLPLVISDRPSMRGSAAIVMVALAALAPLAHAVRLHREQSRTIARYERVVSVLRTELGPGDTFVQFLGDPYLALMVPEAFAGRSPLLGYLVSDHPRRSEAFSWMRQALGRADAIVDDGGLRAPRSAVLPGYRPLYDLFHEQLDRFRCRRTVDGITIAFSRCPAG